ncbi:hypothetical protein [Corynebacterium sp. sy039]|uniref:hypothetical protein n=1 Tax=Corynebacterium sp. sy039 TaxID=2599641 RepID=UPI0011B7C1E0|nr:hypothetical protein [Corynebacterium sp. sy039]QDZ42352.1 hypothetical protein FQV43_03640 [Corynebacterium sp. sy039]
MKKVINFPSAQRHLRRRSLSAHTISATHPETIAQIHTMLKHPRSLARPMPHWRPLRKKLPVTPRGEKLVLALSRHRVGMRIQARMTGYGATATPAYVVSMRISDPHSGYVAQDTAYAWVTAIAGAKYSHCIHEFVHESTPTFAWLVDKDFTPIPSPASLFENTSQAA